MLQVTEALQEGIAKANKKAISRAQNIQKLALLPADFSVGDELGMFHFSIRLNKLREI